VKQEIEILKEILEDNNIIFKSIVEDSLDGYMDIHLQDNYSFISSSFKRLLGYNEYEIENTIVCCSKLIYQIDKFKLKRAFLTHLKSKDKTPFKIEIRFLTKKKEVLWVYFSGKIIKWDKFDNPIRFVGSLTNITQLKQLDEIKRYSYELEQKNKELEHFAHVISHDLKEPINTVIGFNDLIRLKIENTTENLEYSNYINDSCKRMLKSITDLLKISNLGENISFSKVNCNQILKEIILDLSHRISEKNANIIFENLPTVIGFKTEIRLLFQNIISNALKFSKPNITPKIQISAEITEGNYYFKINDNGIGIAKNNIDKIFEVFKKLHHNSQYEGSGIGLFHCKKVVELHQGSIWVTSKLNSGTTFHFTIAQNPDSSDIKQR